MIRCTAFRVYSDSGQTKLSYTYDVLNPETGETVSKGEEQTVIPMDRSVSESIETIRRFLNEHGNISAESLKPRRY